MLRVIVSIAFDILSVEPEVGLAPDNLINPIETSPRFWHLLDHSMTHYSQKGWKILELHPLTRILSKSPLIIDHIQFQ